jgi:carbon storage regulator CsrA
MLCVTRKEDETISITLEDGRVITVKVAQIRRKQVRIRVEADPTIKVWRGELRGDDG